MSERAGFATSGRHFAFRLKALGDSYMCIASFGHGRAELASCPLVAAERDAVGLPGELGEKLQLTA